METEKAIAEMKARIRFHVQNEVNALQVATGLTPSWISIPMIDVTAYGEAGPRHVVGEVTIRIER